MQIKDGNTPWKRDEKYNACRVLTMEHAKEMLRQYIETCPESAEQLPAEMDTTGANLNFAEKRITLVEGEDFYWAIGETFVLQKQFEALGFLYKKDIQPHVAGYVVNKSDENVAALKAVCRTFGFIVEEVAE